MSEYNTLAEALKLRTHEHHENVDQLINSLGPFLNKENYAKFLQLQEIFHKIVDSIYSNKNLNDKIPGLKELSRHEKVKLDMKDLGVDSFMLDSVPQPEGDEAIGWLYCAEGSNLGAAFLFKMAGNIGFNENFGARHLAAHPQGRGKHWREFVALFNHLPHQDQSNEKVIQGAINAFNFYADLARTIFKNDN